jgi:hypothetical protein
VYILAFIGLNGQNRCDITFKADNLEILKHDPKLNRCFIRGNLICCLGRISLSIKIGKKKNLVDTGNLTAPQPNLTMIFEEGYSVEIEGLYQ